MSDNLDKVMGQLNDFIQSFDFTRPGIEGSMGMDAAHAVAERIADQAATEQRTTDDEQFPKNEKNYAEWKDEKYGVGNPAYGIRTGQMLSMESLLGKVEVSADQVTITYGTNRPPERSSASDYISDADKKVTDRQKAGWNDPKMSHFFKAGAEGHEAVREVIKEALERAVEEENSNR